MARDDAVYGILEHKYAIQAETTAMTPNVTTMYELPVASAPILPSENAYRRQDQKNGTGRTIKEGDMVTETKGTDKVITVPMYLDVTILAALLQNGFGKVVEATGEILFTFNHTPAEVGNGGSFTDWTGTFTFADISPQSGETVVWPGCVVNSLSWSTGIGAEGGKVLVNAEFVTRSEALEDQATPTSLQAYTLSDLGIYDLCTTAQVGGKDVQLQSFELNHAFNPKMVGVCADGDAASIGKNIPNADITGTIVYAEDTNVPDDHKKGRTDTTFAISLSDGSDFFVTIAKAVATNDVTLTDVEGVSMWNLQFRAVAGTSGNVLEEQVA